MDTEHCLLFLDKAGPSLTLNNEVYMALTCTFCFQRILLNEWVALV